MYNSGLVKTTIKESDKLLKNIEKKAESENHITTVRKPDVLVQIEDLLKGKKVIMKPGFMKNVSYKLNHKSSKILTVKVKSQKEDEKIESAVNEIETNNVEVKYF
jgi:hypothetical protein